MNKKLIAIAIAAAVTAPVVSAADTTLYGRVHMSISNTDSGAPGSRDQWNVSDHSNRVGIKGSEDLGNGLKAIFQYEMGYNGADDINSQTVTSGGVAIPGVATAGNVFSARNSFIGLAGDFGQVRVGRHDTPAKVAFYAAGNERLGDSMIDLNSHFGFDELRTADAIAYISPSFSGVTVAAAIVPGEAQNVAGATGLADAYSIGVMYAGHGLKAGLGYTNGEDFTGATEADLLNLGASYTFGSFSVGAQWQETNVGTTKKEAWALTGSANFGNNAIHLAYGNAESGATDADTFGVALQHKMSKRTSAYVAFRAGEDATSAVASNWIGNGGTAGTGDEFGIGMIHTF